MPITHDPFAIEWVAPVTAVEDSSDAAWDEFERLGGTVPPTVVRDADAHRKVIEGLRSFNSFDPVRHRDHGLAAAELAALRRQAHETFLGIFG